MPYESIREQLPAALGEGLAALYVFGSVATGRYQTGSDVNLLLVTKANTPLADVRAAFLPLWQEHGAILRSGPALTTVDELRRLVLLNPNFGYQLAHSARRLAGDNVLEAPAPFDARAALALDCQAALQASGALAPTMLSQEQAADQGARLAALARRLVDAPAHSPVPTLSVPSIWRSKPALRRSMSRRTTAS